MIHYGKDVKYWGTYRPNNSGSPQKTFYGNDYYALRDHCRREMKKIPEVQKFGGTYDVRDENGIVESGILAPGATRFHGIKKRGLKNGA